MKTVYALSQELQGCHQLLKRAVASSAYPIVNLQELFGFFSARVATDLSAGVPEPAQRAVQVIPTDREQCGQTVKVA